MLRRSASTITIPHLACPPSQSHPLAFVIFQRHGDRAPAGQLFDDRPTSFTSEESGLGELGGVFLKSSSNPREKRYFAPPSPSPSPLSLSSFATSTTKISNEKSYWSSAISSPSLVDTSPFPVDRQQSLQSWPSSPATFIDDKNPPFGHLTRFGAEQLRSVGHHFRSTLRFNPSQWDVTCVSTNYLRTVTSAQNFLHGLYNFDEIKIKTQSFPKIEIRPPASCTLNAYDRDPKLMKSLVKAVKESALWTESPDTGGRKHEENSEVWQAVLARFFDGREFLSEKHDGDAADADDDVDVDVHWMHLFDHITSQEYHGDGNKLLPSIFGNVPQGQFGKLASRVKKVLNTRFKLWYEDSRIIGQVGVPCLVEVRDVFEKAINEENGLPPLWLFSAHDVTLLSVLYAIKADELLEISNEKEKEGFWPPYASSVTFELSRDLLVTVKCNGRNVRSPFSIAEFDEMLNKVKILNV